MLIYYSFIVIAKSFMIDDLLKEFFQNTFGLIEIGRNCLKNKLEMITGFKFGAFIA